MRRLLLPVVLLAALVFAADASAGRVYVIKGHGWGHGWGMGQWGAYGYALKGWSYRQILSHFYTDTAPGHVSPSRKVRVLLTSGRGSFTVSSTRAIKVDSESFPAGSYTVERNADHTRIRIGGKSFSSPVTISSRALLSVDGERFRGVLQVYLSGTLSVVNKLGIDAYVRGVVPNEMPASWHRMALRAQAVAARTYALAVTGGCGGGVIGTGVLCRGVSDQVYNGRDFEQATTNDAVVDTSGEVRLYSGNLAVTYFSSSTGGRSATGNQPYLVSVPDAGDSISSHHYWGPRDSDDDCAGTSRDCVYSSASLAAKLGVDAVRGIAVGARNATDHRVVRLDVDTGPSTVSFSGAEARSKLGLRSTWFSVGVQNLTASDTRARCAQAVRLAVLARRVGAPSLYQRPATSTTWTKIALSKKDAAHWATMRHPCVSTDYRLVTPDAAGPRVHVDVMPSIAFDVSQPSNRSGLTGDVRPLSLAGTALIVQRDTGPGWARVADTTIRSDGTFKASFDVTEGDYRAKVVPPDSSGLVTGFSPRLTVVFG
jgi:stage II sporulation protein D